MTPTSTDDDSFTSRRMRMVHRDIASRGVADERVLEAMRTVRRERFVKPHHVRAAYRDRPLPIDAGQTISQPFIVALMAEAAEIGPDDRVLEIGTGSGYGAAVLSCLAREVWSVERHHRLVVQAERRLIEEGYEAIQVIEGDGTLGWPPAAPYDAIIVTAGGPDVPRSLRDQLADGGRLILPVGSATQGQELLRVRRTDDGFHEEDLGAVRFVPLVGEQGWADERDPG